MQRVYLRRGKVLKRHSFNKCRTSTRDSASSCRPTILLRNYEFESDWCNRKMIFQKSPVTMLELSPGNLLKHFEEQRKHETKQNYEVKGGTVNITSSKSASDNGELPEVAIFRSIPRTTACISYYEGHVNMAFIDYDGIIRT